MSDSENTLAKAVTAHRSFALGGHVDLFAVQAGVPLEDALNNLSLLIGCANATITDGAWSNEDAAVSERIEPIRKRDVRKHVPIPAAVRAEYERQLFALLEGVPAPVTKPKVLTLSDAAREAWLNMAQAIEDEQGDGGRYAAISDWTSKLPGAVARIAALLELATTGLHACEVNSRPVVALFRGSPKGAMA